MSQESLVYAASTGDAKGIRRLVADRGLNPRGKDSSGHGGIHWAAQSGRPNIVSLFITEFSVSPESVADNGDLPVHSACRAGCNATLELLLNQHGANANAQNTLNGASALHLSAQEGHASTATLLVRTFGADLHAKTADGLCPLHSAAQNGRDEMIRLLYDLGANLYATTNTGSTALHLASDWGHSSTILLLIEMGLNSNCSDTENWRPLHCASRDGHDAAVRLLVQLDANPNAVNNSGFSPIHLAAREGQATTVRLLSELGSKLSSVAVTSGDTPLHCAARGGQANCAHLLVELGADLGAANVLNGATSVHLAAQEGHEKVLRCLLALGADPNPISFIGTRPLHLAALNGHDDTIRLLVSEFGVDPNCPSGEDDSSALHLASLHGNLSTVRTLVSLGAGPNICSRDNSTPLHYSCQEGHLPVSNLLVELGCDISKTTLNGRTAASVALMFGHTAVYSRLELVSFLKAKAQEGEWQQLKNAIEEAKFSVPPVQWVPLMPLQAQTQLSAWVQSTIVDSRACYCALYRPLVASGPLTPYIRLKVAHDGLKNIVRLITSYLVFSQPATRRFFREADEILMKTRSASEGSHIHCGLQ